ncbi:alpha/beta hydrolase [Prosthecochloris sp. N3]|uniref:Alpha/beta hydrolase n=1 Tax=Prosthecochloris ethylica TaxID=2743976 RepID=A0ABR9XU64_9CHLB|nr:MULTISPECIES: alpha/beta hydrolase [Prosthecochloris]MBF0587269.1 alpha/beta hydrolase [Prosthecochloris ethylica]MBF0637509.1 alpha/beta hydrolase [Prosthecochloris ethylica]NUK48077.1 alpha/beta hydrolase [Prosthecochloris ethylica]RNA66099.1 alpha/beta hydrolase [Prosthecochloris sp. ZM_2]RNA66376.1 alpha/beta hydrolase [Prosthecochloris sp. ZM_2]
MESFESQVQRRSDSDSRFLDCNGFRVHYKIAGSGEPVIMLLHGSFLSIRSWRDVMEPLSQHGTVIAFDRPAFGLTSRPVPSKHNEARYSPEAQSDLVIGVLKELGFTQAVLVGNSTGGTLALLTALRYPRQVQGLVLAGPMIYSGYATSEVPAAVKPFMKALSPVFSRVMKALITRLYDRNIRGFWYKPERLDDETLAEFRNDLMVGDWSRGFWELFLETHHLHLDERLATLSLPSLVVTGEHDLTVNARESIRLANELPGAGLKVIEDCAHLPQEEKPGEFVDALVSFLGNLRGDV